MANRSSLNSSSPSRVGELQDDIKHLTEIPGLFLTSDIPLKAKDDLLVNSTQMNATTESRLPPMPPVPEPIITPDVQFQLSDLNHISAQVPMPVNSLHAISNSDSLPRITNTPTSRQRSVTIPETLEVHKNGQFSGQVETNSPAIRMNAIDDTQVSSASQVNVSLEKRNFEFAKQNANFDINGQGSSDLGNGKNKSERISPAQRFSESRNTSSARPRKEKTEKIPSVSLEVDSSKRLPSDVEVLTLFKDNTTNLLSPDGAFLFTNTSSIRAGKGSKEKSSTARPRKNLSTLDVPKDQHNQFSHSSPFSTFAAPKQNPEDGNVLDSSFMSFTTDSSLGSTYNRPHGHFIETDRTNRPSTNLANESSQPSIAYNVLSSNDRGQSVLDFRQAATQKSTNVEYDSEIPLKNVEADKPWILQTPSRAVCLRNSSFFIFPSFFTPRVIIYNIVHHWIFELCLGVLIIAYTILQASWSRTVKESRANTPTYITWSNVFFTVLYLAEGLAKLFSHGAILHKEAYFRSYWNILDFSAIVLSILTLSISSFANYSCIRLLRLPKCLTAVPYPASIRLGCRSFIKGVWKLLQIALIVLVLTFFFGLLGVQLFNGRFRYRCQNSTTKEFTAQLCRPHNVDEDSTSKLLADTLLSTTENTQKKIHNPDFYWGYTCPSGFDCNIHDGDPMLDNSKKISANSAIDKKNLITKGPGDKYGGYQNFDDIGHGMLSVWQISTFQNWPLWMTSTNDTMNVVSFLYYFFLITIMSFIVPFLLVGVLASYMIRLRVDFVTNKINYLLNILSDIKNDRMMKIKSLSDVEKVGSNYYTNPSGLSIDRETGFYSTSRGLQDTTNRIGSHEQQDMSQKNLELISLGDYRSASMPVQSFDKPPNTPIDPMSSHLELSPSRVFTIPSRWTKECGLQLQLALSRKSDQLGVWESERVKFLKNPLHASNSFVDVYHMTNQDPRSMVVLEGQKLSASVAAGLCITGNDKEISRGNPKSPGECSGTEKSKKEESHCSDSPGTQLDFEVNQHRFLLRYSASPFCQGQDSLMTTFHSFNQISGTGNKYFPSAVFPPQSGSQPIARDRSTSPTVILPSQHEYPREEREAKNLERGGSSSIPHGLIPATRTQPVWSNGTNSHKSMEKSDGLDIGQKIVIQDPEGGSLSAAFDFYAKWDVIRNFIHLLTEGYPRIFSLYLWEDHCLRRQLGIFHLEKANVYAPLALEKAMDLLADLSLEPDASQRKSRRAAYESKFENTGWTVQGDTVSINNDSPHSNITIGVPYFLNDSSENMYNETLITENKADGIKTSSIDPLRSTKIIVDHAPMTWFQWLMIFFILSNAIFLITRHKNQSHKWENGLWYLAIIHTLIFFIEAMLRVIALSPEIFVWSNPMNLLNLILVVLGFIELGYDGSNTITVLNLYRVLWVFPRMKWISPLHTVSLVLIHSFWDVITALSLYIVYAMLAIVFGMALFSGQFLLFGGTKILFPASGSGLWNNFSYASFLVATGLSRVRDEWLPITWASLHIHGNYTIIFFILVVFIGFYCLQMFFIALYLVAFQMEEEKDSVWISVTSHFLKRPLYDFKAWNFLKMYTPLLSDTSDTILQAKKSDFATRSLNDLSFLNEKQNGELYGRPSFSMLMSSENVYKLNPAMYHLLLLARNRDSKYAEDGQQENPWRSDNRPPASISAVGHSSQAPRASELSFGVDQSLFPQGDTSGMNILARSMNDSFPGLSVEQRQAFYRSQLYRAWQAQLRYSRVLVEQYFFGRRPNLVTKTMNQDGDSSNRPKEYANTETKEDDKIPSGPITSALNSSSVAPSAVSSVNDRAQDHTPLLKKSPVFHSDESGEFLEGYIRLLEGPKYRYYVMSSSAGRLLYDRCNQCGALKQIPLRSPTGVLQQTHNSLHVEQCPYAAIRMRQVYIWSVLFGFVKFQKEHGVPLTTSVVETIVGQAWSCGLLLGETIEEMSCSNLPSCSRNWDCLIQALQMQFGLLCLSPNEEQVGRATTAYIAGGKIRRLQLDCEFTKEPAIDRSFFIFRSSNPLRHFCQSVITNAWVEGFILLCIFTASILFALHTPGDDTKGDKYRAFNIVDDIIIVIFGIEMLFKWISHGVFLPWPSAYIFGFDNLVDAFVFSISIASWVRPSLGLRYLQVLRCFRLLIPLASYFKGTWNHSASVVISTIKMSSPTLVAIMFIMFLNYWIWTALGLQLFMGKQQFCDNLDVHSKNMCTSWKPIVDSSDIPLAPDTVSKEIFFFSWLSPQRNFDDFPNGLLTLIEVSTGSWWLDIIQLGTTARLGSVREYGAHLFKGFFFLAFYLISNIILVSCFIAAVVYSYTVTKYALLGGWSLTLRQQLWVGAQQRLTKLHPLHRLRPLSNSWSRFWGFIMLSKWMEGFLFLVLVANMITMSLQTFTMSESLKSRTQNCQYVWIGIFTTELLLKLSSFGPKRYWSKFPHIFDTIVMILAFVQISLYNTSGPSHQIPFNVNVLRILRIGRVFPLISSFCSYRCRFTKNLRLFYRTLTESWLSLINVTVILILGIYVFAILGMNLLGVVHGPPNSWISSGLYDVPAPYSASFPYQYATDAPPFTRLSHTDAVLVGGTTQYQSAPYANFGTFVNSLIMTFRLTTLDSWTQMLRGSMTYDPPNYMGLSLDSFESSPSGSPPWYQQTKCNSEDYPYKTACGTNWAPVFFIGWFIIGFLIFLSLYIAVIVDQYITLSYVEDIRENHPDIDNFIKLWESFDQDGKGYLPVEILPKLFAKLESPLLKFSEGRISRSELLRFFSQYQIVDHRGFAYFDEVLIPLVREAINAGLSTDEREDLGRIWRRTFLFSKNRLTILYHNEPATVDITFAVNYVAAAYRCRRDRRNCQALFYNILTNGHNQLIAKKIQDSDGIGNSQHWGIGSSYFSDSNVLLYLRQKEEKEREKNRLACFKLTNGKAGVGQTSPHRFSEGSTRMHNKGYEVNESHNMVGSPRERVDSHQIYPNHDNFHLERMVKSESVPETTFQSLTASAIRMDSQQTIASSLSSNSRQVRLPDDQKYSPGNPSTGVNYSGLNSIEDETPSGTSSLRTDRVSTSGDGVQSPGARKVGLVEMKIPGDAFSIVQYHSNLTDSQRKFGPDRPDAIRRHERRTEKLLREHRDDVISHQEGTRDPSQEILWKSEDHNSEGENYHPSLNSENSVDTSNESPSRESFDQSSQRIHDQDNSEKKISMTPEMVNTPQLLYNSSRAHSSGVMDRGHSNHDDYSLLTSAGMPYSSTRRPSQNSSLSAHGHLTEIPLGTPPEEWCESVHKVKKNSPSSSTSLPR